MKEKNILNFSKKIFFTILLATSPMFAHTALMSCFDNADGTITCEGGFSDGSSSTGVKFYILEKDKKVFETKFNEDSEVTFDKPNSSYIAVFDAGEGHKVHIKGSDITE